MRPYTLRQLDSFLAVAEEMSVSRAARRLHVTQPAISMQLRQLEEALGSPLVQPAGRGIILTDAGVELHEYARRVTFELTELDNAMAERRGAYRGRIELAIITTAKYFMPMLLMRFRKKYPALEIGLRVHNREAILELLSRNEVDLIVMGRVPDELECIAAPFATNPLGIVSTPDHPLSRRRRLDLRALKGENFVARELGSGTRLSMERLFARHRIKPRIVMEMPSNETIKQAVMAGMGLALLSLRTTRQEIAHGHLALLDVDGLPLVRHWYVTRLKAKRPSPAALEFERFLLEEGAPLIDAWS
ncbi:MAG: LysR family transcriptional regulator [Burkholderiales bacterium]|nr:LysR family transcriptional regulator [Burkholderiales bacterium]